MFGVWVQSHSSTAVTSFMVAFGSYSVGPYPLPVNGSWGQRTSLIHRHKSRFRFKRGYSCGRWWDPLAFLLASLMLFEATWGLLRLGPVGQALVFSLCQQKCVYELGQAQYNSASSRAGERQCAFSCWRQHSWSANGARTRFRVFPAIHTHS